MNAVVDTGSVVSPMVLVDLEHGSPEWLAWRAEGIGASDAATIMGENPYQTPAQLWAEKVGLVPAPDLSKNPHVQRGLRHEAEARERFEQDYDEFVVPLNAEHAKYRFIRASFDGILTGGYPLEIKCPSGRRLEAARRMAEQAQEGAYLLITAEQLREMETGYYFAQLQQQMLVAQADFAVLYIYDTERKTGYPFSVQADPDYQELLIEKVSVFWQHVLDETEPELDPERDVFKASRLLDDADPLSLEPDHPWLVWLSAERAYLELDARIKVLEADLKDLKAARANAEGTMVALMGHHLRAEGETGLKVTRFTRKGAVDYKAALADLAPEVDDAALEAYRKQSAMSVKITLPKVSK